MFQQNIYTIRDIESIWHLFSEILFALNQILIESNRLDNALHHVLLSPFFVERKYNTKEVASRQSDGV